MNKKKKEIEELEPPLPPDGGWGWVVMIASFFSNLFVDGILYTFGVLFIYLSDSFPEASKAQISTVGSLLGGIYLIVGPFVGGLANKFGCRPVAAVGAVIASFSFILSTFSTSIEMMLGTYGFLGGIGFGLLYLPSIVMVGIYFDSKRAFATGIAVCGSGIGTLVFAPLAQLLCDWYGWKGATLIMAGLLLNGIPCALVYRPLKAKKRNKKIVKDILCDAEKLKAEKKLEEEILRQESEVGDLPSVHPLSRADVLYGGSVTHLHEFTVNPNMEDYVQSYTDIPHAVKRKDEGLCAPVFDIFKKMFDFSLLVSPTFLLIALAGVFGFLSFYAPFVYTVDYAEQSTDSTTANWLISVIGLSNTVSRVIAGWLADRPWADSPFIHNCALIFAGITTCALPFLSHNIVFFYIFAVLFGFSIASFIALRSIVICDLLGVQKLTNAFGIVALFQGFALLFGTPLLGSIYDRTGSYSNAYIVSGVIMILGGIFCMPIRKVNRWEKKRELMKKKDYKAVYAIDPQA